MSEGPETDDGYFDEQVAATYDDDAEVFDPAVVDPMVDALASLAGQGAALEFGVGTGRIALPLARRGVAVHGIDMSRAMLARMAEKPEAGAVGVTVGDFSSARVEGAFTLVYLVFNTIMNLTEQASQVACFRNAAAHLSPGGHFVIEVMMPRLQRLSPGDSVMAFRADADHWGIDEYDLVTQGLVSHHLRLVNGRTERFSAPFRYVWPAELDLMAELAGLLRVQRWGGWKGEPFTATSDSHVSIWRKADPSEDTSQR